MVFRAGTARGVKIISSGGKAMSVGDEPIVIGRLTRWAAWKMNSGVHLGYPGKVSFMRLVPSDNRHNG